MKKSDDTGRVIPSKYQQAAHKAWKTIEKKRRERRAASLRKIDEWVEPKVISHIAHPEIGPQPIKRTTYGKGLIHLFAKTPSNIVCGNFWELRWAFGCPLNCSYCYLRGTVRGDMKPRIVNPEVVLKALDEAFDDREFNGGKPAIFNAGELADSLMNPRAMSIIVEKFASQSKHRLFLLSKFGPQNIQFLLDRPEEGKKQIVCSWSVNPDEVVKRWEREAPSPAQRIEAAKTVYEAGYETRIRIDPMFPIDGWKVCYDRLCAEILDNLRPSRIILGTPRGLWKTIEYAEKADVDMSWASYFAQGDTGWGKKLHLATRLAMYTHVSGTLVSLGYDISRISLCKETVSLWEAFGRPFSSFICQCYSR